jgi:hypothetical protein
MGDFVSKLANDKDAIGALLPFFKMSGALQDLADLLHGLVDLMSMAWMTTV